MLRIRPGMERRSSSIIRRRKILESNATSLFAGSLYWWRTSGYAFEHRSGRQVRSVDPARFQPDFMGDHFDEVELVAPRPAAERPVSASLPQGSAVAGYCRCGGSISSEPAGRRVRRRVFGVQAAAFFSVGILAQLDRGAARYADWSLGRDHA